MRSAPEDRAELELGLDKVVPRIGDEARGLHGNANERAALPVCDPGGGREEPREAAEIPHAAEERNFDDVNLAPWVELGRGEERVEDGDEVQECLRSL